MSIGASDAAGRSWALFFARGVLGLIFFMAGFWKVFTLTPAGHAHRWFVDPYADTDSPDVVAVADGRDDPDRRASRRRSPAPRLAGARGVDRARRRAPRRHVRPPAQGAALRVPHARHPAPRPAPLRSRDAPGCRPVFARRAARAAGPSCDERRPLEEAVRRREPRASLRFDGRGPGHPAAAAPAGRGRRGRRFARLDPRRALRVRQPRPGRRRAGLDAHARRSFFRWAC